MREIKFRFWDGSEMRKNITYLEFDCGGMPQYVHFGAVGYEDEFYDVEDNLMQYTGLKDKNGKEIYEGDILELDIEDLKKIGWNITRKLSSIVIRDMTDNTNIKLIEEHTNAFGNPETTKERKNIIKVIGNIYENPELLEGE